MSSDFEQNLDAALDSFRRSFEERLKDLQTTVLERHACEILKLGEDAPHRMTIDLGEDSPMCSSKDGERGHEIPRPLPPSPSPKHAAKANAWAGAAKGKDKPTGGTKVQFLCASDSESSEDQGAPASPASPRSEGAPRARVASPDSAKNRGMKRLVSGESLCDSPPSTPPPGESDADSFKVLDVWLGVPGTRQNFFQQQRTNRNSRLMHAVDSNEMELEDDEGAFWTFVSRFMIKPTSPKHIVWNLFGMVFIAYDIVTLPLELFEPEDQPFTVAMTWVIRVFWTATIPVSFCIGYTRHTGSTDMSPKNAARRYVFSWLPLDVIMVVVDWMEELSAEIGDEGVGNAGATLRSVRVIRMLRAVRVFRLIKGREIADFIAENIRSERLLLLAAFFRIIILMLAFVHFVGCIWYGLGAGTSTGWVDHSQLRNKDMNIRYLRSFHWAIAIITGETLVMPVNTVEMVFTVCMLLISVVISASFVSSITTAMTRLQILYNEEAQKQSVLKRYLNDRNISPGLRLRVQRNAQHAMELREKNMPESSVELLTYISEPLRVELHFEVHSVTLLLHPFFRCYNELNAMGLRKVCHVAVEPFNVSSGDFIFMDQEVPPVPVMIFVLHGSLHYEQERADPKRVARSDWLCEAPLWTTWRHCGTLRAGNETQLLRLDAKRFQETCSAFPDSHVVTYAEGFVARLNETNDRCSDIGSSAVAMELVEEAFPESESSESSFSEDGVTQQRSSKFRASVKRTSNMLRKRTRSLRETLHGKIPVGGFAARLRSIKSLRMTSHGTHHHHHHHHHHKHGRKAPWSWCPRRLWKPTPVVPAPAPRELDGPDEPGVMISSNSRNSEARADLAGAT